MTDEIFLFDTETVSLPPRNFIYDIAWVITDKFGKITKRRNFLIKEVITSGSKMMSAFFAKKIFHFYIPALDAGTMSLTALNDVQNIMYNDLQTCKTIAAYNVGFDLSALRNTVDILNGQQEVILDEYKILCLWNFACNTLLNTPAYHKAASANGWKSRAGNFKTSAEASYRFISGKTQFVESHTALDDCYIENDIMAACFAKHRAIPYDVYNNAPWRLAQTPEQLENMRLVRRMEQKDLFDALVNQDRA